MKIQTFFLSLFLSLFLGCSKTVTTAGYNCKTGVCVLDSSGGTYSTLTVCQTVCGSSGSNCGTITDVDGNTYNTVKIGTQCWMKENLKTSKYRDGSAIPSLDNLSWINTTSGAYAIYYNNAANNTTYGKLYNYYTVVDSRNLCPTGWHVPSDAEWDVLANYLGGSAVAGGKMKTTTGWNAPNTGANDSSGFSGVPGGYRSNVGSFNAIGDNGDFWSSTPNGAADAWGRNLGYTNADLNRGNYGERSGFSVRCVRD